MALSHALSKCLFQLNLKSSMTPIGFFTDCYLLTEHDQFWQRTNLISIGKEYNSYESHKAQKHFLIIHSENDDHIISIGIDKHINLAKVTIQLVHYQVPHIVGM